MQNNLWSQAYREVSNSKLLFYNRAGGPSSKGFIVSNEVDHFSMTIRKGLGQCLLGVGTTINWDIASQRKSSFLILIDKSPDVAIAHLCYYRPIFLVSDTPSEFLSHISGFSLDADTSSIFERILKGDPPEARGILALSEKLSVLEKKGTISEVEKNFCLNAVESRPQPNNSKPFKDAHLDHPLVEMFAYLYYPRAISIATKFPRLFIRPKKFSFLASQENYMTVRESYLNDKVRIGIGDIYDKKLYQTIQMILKEEKLALTDVYISNIPDFVAPRSNEDSRAALNKIIDLLPLEEGKTVCVYETRGLKVPYRYITHNLNVNGTKTIP